MKPQPTPVNLAQTLRAASALATAYANVCRQMHTALKPLLDHVHEHPEVLDQWRREREAEALLGSCHCLCGIHREQTDVVCTSVAEPGLTVRFNSPSVGPTDVAMCRSCYEAHRAMRAAATGR